ncbi:hypothetical protein [Methylobacterium sp. WL116]|nr:hypothetical protein [Methylobacterium sp. WL116]
MSDRLSRWLLLVVLAATPAAAEPAVTILDLPFQATAAARSTSPGPEA